MTLNQREVQHRITQGVNAWDREAYAEALSIFDSVLDQVPSYPDVHNRRGLCLAMLGRLDEAMTAFDAAIGLAPTYAEAHLNRGIVLKELGKADEAQEAFDRASRLDQRHGAAFPSHVGNQIAVTHAKVGDLYLVAGHPGLAAEQYRAALAVRPGYLDIRTKLAAALMETGELDQAREELKGVLEGDPDFTGARLRMGIVLHRMGDADAAAEAWRSCAEADPRDFRPRAYLASLGRKQEDA